MKQQQKTKNKAKCMHLVASEDSASSIKFLQSWIEIF
jgi:hypothetical protein